MFSIALLAVACDKSDKPGTTNTSSAPNNAATTTAATPAAEPKAAPSATVAEAAKTGKPAVTWKDAFSTPESVIYDDVADAYLVSNIDGKPGDADGKGFISKLSPDGAVTASKWIESGKNKVVLNAPKGLAFLGDRLYVADLDTVRIFDRKTGAPVGDVKIPGATFLNDLTTTSDGHVLVSDSGFKVTAKGFDQTGSDAVYSIDKDKKVTTVSKSKDLGNPNGLATKGDKTWVAAGSDLYSIDAKGKKGDVQKLPKGTLDGVFFVGDEIVVSSWDGSAIYRGKPGGELKAVIEDIKSPADIGYDTKRGRVLVPIFTENEVRAYDLK
jgi:hypothetical protein